MSFMIEAHFIIYFTEINVGEQFFIDPIIQQKKNGSWVEVPKDDYLFECDYDGTKYGEYNFVVYLKNYTHVKFEDVVNVLPKKIELPTFSTVYTGQPIDIKSKIDAEAEELYEVTKYTKKTNVGVYSASVTLLNPDMYVWVDANDEILRGNTRSIDWEIVKAPAKNYSGTTHLTVYYGDTLYDIAESNNLKNITWVNDSSTIITNQAYATAKYNESVGNYEDTLITIFFDEIIRTSHYRVEYYFHDGSEYVIDENKSQTISANIGEFVSVEVPNIDGYEVNNMLSITQGRVVKQDGLVLKIYYIAE